MIVANYLFENFNNYFFEAGNSLFYVKRADFFFSYLKKGKIISKLSKFLVN